MATLNEIKNKINEYTIQDTYTLEKLNNLLDKQIIKKLEYKKDNTTISIIYNDYGLYLRTWENNQLECQLIKYKN